MRKCSATKRNGEPCTLPAQGSAGLCWAHDPANAEKRRKGASRGGRAWPLTDLANLKQKLVELGDDVLAGRVNRGNAAVAVSAYGTAVKAIEAVVRVRELEESRIVETQLKVWEQRELAQRLEKLEELAEEERGSWGA